MHSCCPGKKADEGFFSGLINLNYLYESLGVFSSGVIENRPFSQRLYDPSQLQSHDKQLWMYPKAWNFFKSNSASVEITHHDRLVRVQFPRPPMCSFRTERTKQKVDAAVRRSRRQTQRVGDIFEKTDYVLDEMDNLSRRNWQTLSLPLVPWILKQEKLWHNMTFILSLVLNFILLMSFQVSFSDCQDDEEDYIKFQLWSLDFGHTLTQALFTCLGTLLIFSAGTCSCICRCQLLPAL